MHSNESRALPQHSSNLLTKKVELLLLGVLVGPFLMTGRTLLSQQ